MHTLHIDTARAILKSGRKLVASNTVSDKDREILASEGFTKLWADEVPLKVVGLDEARRILSTPGADRSGVHVEEATKLTLEAEGLWKPSSDANVPLTVTQLCKLAGYSKAAAPLVAAGADAATVQEILLSDRRDEFMGALASGTADAKYVLELANVENAPLTKVVARMVTEHAKGSK